MNCEGAQGQMIEAVYGELPAGVQASFEEHLAGCADCRLAYEGLAQTDKMLELVPDAAARVDLGRLYREAAARGRRNSVRWRRVAVAAAAVLLVVSTLAVWRGRIEVEPDRLVISWRAAAEQPGIRQPVGIDSAVMLAAHARHLATVDETIAMLLAELDTNERKRLESLTLLQELIQGSQQRSNTRIDEVRQDVRDLYLASFSSVEQEPGGQP